MSEPVQFWLDNKMSAGIKVAAIANQTLVVYREKFYVVEKDAAHSRGGKACVIPGHPCRPSGRRRCTAMGVTVERSASRSPHRPRKSPADGADDFRRGVPQILPTQNSFPLPVCRRNR